MIKFLNTNRDKSDVEDIMNRINDYELYKKIEGFDSTMKSNVTKDYQNLKGDLIDINNSYDISLPAIVNYGGIKGNIKYIIKKIVSKLLSWYIKDINDRQVYFNAHVVRVLNEENIILDNLMKDNEKLRDENNEILKMNNEILIKNNELLKEEEYKDIWNQKWYLEFENMFRGSVEVIEERIKKYIPYYNGKSQVVDLGCGRGEFLGLLQKNGINGTGVDINSNMIQECKDKNLNVFFSDAIEYVDKLEGNSVGGFFCSQVVEHLNLGQLLKLVELCYDKLEKDGVLIIETVNPLTLGIFCYGFYIDPTHSKPVHPAMLRFVMETMGFEVEPIQFIDEFPNEYKIEIEDDMSEGIKRAIVKLNEQIYGAQDYFIVCRKK